MLTISLIAAGLMAVAALLMTRSAPAVRTADERGITLQTLIVTAVLVLMAVAAGVVIVAITNSASENLTEVDPAISGNCNSVEVYDPTVASGDVPGYNHLRNAEGSGHGCIPVCMWVDDGDTDGSVDTGDTLTYNRRITGDSTITYTASPSGATYLMLSETEIFADDDTRTAHTVGFENGIVAVRLSKGGDKCQAFSATGDVVATA